MNSTNNTELIYVENYTNAPKIPPDLGESILSFDRFSFYMLFIYSLCIICPPLQYLYLNVMMLSNYNGRLGSRFCYYILLSYGLLVSISPPLYYALDTKTFDFINIPTEIPKNITLFNRILSIYMLVIFALNCYNIVFKYLIEISSNRIYIYYITASLYIFTLFLTLFISGLRYVVSDSTNHYCSLNILFTLQYVFCPQTVHLVSFILCVYIIPIGIFLFLYIRIIRELYLKSSFFNRNENATLILAACDVKFLRVSLIITLLFLATNTPFVILGVLYTLNCKIELIEYAVYVEFFALTIPFWYPYFCVTFDYNTHHPFYTSLFHFLRRTPQRQDFDFSEYNVLAKCEASIKEQQEILNGIKVNVDRTSLSKTESKV